MPRANRHCISGYVWLITHRCHKKKILLKFARDRRRFLQWLFEAKERYGLSFAAASGLCFSMRCA